MRLDRLLTLYFFGPLARLRGSLSSLNPTNPSNPIRIPILMYHSISDEPETGRKGIVRPRGPSFRGEVQVGKQQTSLSGFGGPIG
jgi:hypothetical protein